MLNRLKRQHFIFSIEYVEWVEKATVCWHLLLRINDTIFSQMNTNSNTITIKLCTVDLSIIYIR